jgi:acyl-homoserine lactone synthase
MLHAIKGFDLTQRDLLDAAFRFRNDAFVDEAGWESLRRADGREIDQFDTEDTIHVIVSKDSRIQAYSRLNPTTKPHLLSEIYPHLASRGLIRDEHVWEWSRMGTSKSARTDGKGWGGPIGLLVRSITYVALKNNIYSLVWQAHPVWITRASELGFDPVPMGLPQRVEGERVVAAIMQIDEKVFRSMDEAEVAQIGQFNVNEISY